jgi:Putative lumazine-binding
MKPTRLFAVAALVGVSWVVFAAAEEPAAKSDTSADEQAIREVVDKYFRGVVNGDRDLLEQAWYTKGTQMIYIKKLGQTEPSFDAVPIDAAIENWSRIKANSSSGKVLSLDIVEGEMAMVKFDFRYERMHYIEYLTLLKLKDGWKLVSKSYVRIMSDHNTPSKSGKD